MIDADLTADVPPVVEAPPAPQAPEPATERQLPLHFSGSGTEYLRIWLLHTLLILLTLGLYLPFAKARRIRYLYANTWVDGDALAFHGEPKTMFRGFLVLVALFGIYAVGSRFSPLAGYVAFLGLCVLWPALWRAGQQFRLANTSWRGLRMAFRGDLADAYSAFGVAIWPLVLMIGVQQFARAVMEGSVAIDRAWAGGIAFVLVTVGSIGAVLYVALLPLAMAKVKHYQHNHYQIADQRAQMRVPTRRFYLLGVKTLAWVLVPALVVLAVLMIPGMGTWMTDRKFAGTAVIGVTLAAYLLSFVLILPFFHARMQNLTWNHTASAQVRFASRLSFRRLAWLNTKNWVLTLLTLGLYRPFAVVNTWKLKLEAVSITVSGSMAGWDGSDSAAFADASGEAAGDFFGIELGL